MKALANSTGNTAGFGSMNQSVQALAFGGDTGLVGLFNFGDVIEPRLFLAKGVSFRGIPVGSRDGSTRVE